MQVIVRVRDQPVSELWGGAKIDPYYYDGGILLLLYSWQQQTSSGFFTVEAHSNYLIKATKLWELSLVPWFHFSITWLVQHTKVFFHIQVSQTKDSALSSLLRGEVTSVKSYGMSPCDRSYIFSLILGLVSFLFHFWHTHTHHAPWH